MKKLWETKMFSSGDRGKRTERAMAILSTHFLTILLSIFLSIVVFFLIFIIYTSYGGSNEKVAKEAFHHPSESTSLSTSTESAASTEELEPVEETTPTSSSVVSQGGTLIVNAGEGAGQIAARAGISLERLYELNPNKMVGPGGTWWANPGDVVIVN